MLLLITLKYLISKNENKKVKDNEKIFGVDLYKAGLGELIEIYFEEMVDAKGAVRATLKNIDKK